MNRLLLIITALAFTGCTMPEPFRVMSFNIRFANPADGLNRWENRKELVFRTIRSRDPDVIGLQEVLAAQADDVRAALPEYDFVGVGRDDGALAGEMVPILFRRGTFKLVAYGHVWLSEQPDTPGSVGWDAALPRMLTWVQLAFRSNALNKVYVLNTHFDHVGPRARLESARLIRRMCESLGGSPVVVLGDFNAAPDSEPYGALTEDCGNLAELHDTFAVAAAAAGGAAMGAGDPGTFNAFTTEARGPRIDWVLVNRRFEVLEAAVDTTDYAGRVPSDHFPVRATLRLLPAHASGAL